MNIKLDRCFIPAELYEKVKPTVYKKAVGRSGKIWIYQIGEGSSNFIYVSPDRRENFPGFRGFRGFGGSTLSFTLEDGSVEKIQGPWHSNSEALYHDTGVDIRNRHLTYVIIAKNREFSNGTTLVGILYKDEKPMEGDFHRGTIMAMGMAKKLGRPVVCYSESLGGSSEGFVYPDQIDDHGNRREKK